MRVMWCTSALSVTARTISLKHSQVLVLGAVLLLFANFSCCFDMRIVWHTTVLSLTASRSMYIQVIGLKIHVCTCRLPGFMVLGCCTSV